MNTIKQLLQEMNAIRFWTVIFGWGRIKRWIINQLLELQLQLDAGVRDREQLQTTQRELDQAQSTLEATESRAVELQRDKAVLESQLTELRNRVREQDAEIVRLQNTDEQRRADHQTAMETTRESRDEYLELKRRLHEQQLAEQHDRFERQRATWQQHQENVENKVRVLCEKHTIDYVEEVPFRGTPDNAIMISEQYVVFDAKSPAGDDLRNFNTYLKREAEAAKKYAEKKDVNSDIFFVVPSNTLEVIEKTVYTFEKHKVFLIPAELLEVVLLRLKKTEEYEFANQFSPEDREAICRIIGRLMHNAKRRVQIDLTLGKETLALANDCERLLPEDVQKDVLLIERANIVNPTRDSRGKEIALDDLRDELKKVEHKSEDVLSGLEVIPLIANQLPPYGETAS